MLLEYLRNVFEFLKTTVQINTLPSHFQPKQDMFELFEKLIKFEVRSEATLGCCSAFLFRYVGYPLLTEIKCESAVIRQSAICFWQPNAQIIGIQSLIFV